MQIISRAEAKAKGLKRYFTGKPCKHGHVAERVVVNATCVECERASVRKYRLKKSAAGRRRRSVWQMPAARHVYCDPLMGLHRITQCLRNALGLTAQNERNADLRRD